MSTAYSVNASTGATTELDIDVDLMSAFGGETIMATSNKIMLYSGVMDLNEDIDCYWSTGFIDFNTDKLKRFNTNSIYISFYSNTSGQLKVDTSVNGLDVAMSHTQDFDSVSPEMTRIPVPDGFRGRYWRFTVYNSDGNPMKLEDFILKPYITNRSIK